MKAADSEPATAPQERDGVLADCLRFAPADLIGFREAFPEW
jgi:hypothetical protein